ncbi:hypothetical protein [Intestinicryptomonas porci]|uniref:Uncharacterized protein n=1 Tax=Intestinicryptomonas porci TaxID=2926320 RepID=A0ABU4WHV6_9BACT|nr:hypothetical protein [Opitutales bacterium CLA-KB-P66]
MTHENDIAKAILNGTNLTLVDAVRLIRSVLDFMPKGSNLTEAQFCTKIIETGKANFRINEMSFANGFNLYYETKKKTLRPDSKACGFRTFFDIPTQATLRKDTPTFRDSSSIWGTATYLFSAPDTSICRKSLNPTRRISLTKLTGVVFINMNC